MRSSRPLRHGTWRQWWHCSRPMNTPRSGCRRCFVDKTCAHGAEVCEHCAEISKRERLYLDGELILARREADRLRSELSAARAAVLWRDAEIRDLLIQVEALLG